VFEEMGNTSTEMGVLMHAAGGHPDLHTDNWGGGIWIENESEAIRKGLDGGGGGWIFHEILAWIGG
jgi:hypothetical protein